MSDILETLTNLVNHDRKMRYVGVTETYSFEDMKSAVMPEIYELMKGTVAYVPKDGKPRFGCKPDDIRYNIPSIVLPYIESGKMCVAGGFVSDTLNNKEYKDIDLFFTGVSIEEATAIIKTIMHGLIDSGNLYSITRNHHTISLVTSTFEIQIMFRLYNSVSEVIHSLIFLHQLLLISLDGIILQNFLRLHTQTN